MTGVYWFVEASMVRRNKLTRRRQPGMVIGVAWYRKEQWDRLRQVCPDGADLEERFDDWYEHGVRSFRELAEQCEPKGMRLVKVDVDIEELLRWCAANGLTPDGQARSRFAAEKASEISPDQSGPSSPTS